MDKVIIIIYLWFRFNCKKFNKKKWHGKAAYKVQGWVEMACCSSQHHIPGKNQAPLTVRARRTLRPDGIIGVRLWVMHLRASMGLSETSICLGPAQKSWVKNRITASAALASHSPMLPKKVAVAAGAVMIAKITSAMASMPMNFLRFTSFPHFREWRGVVAIPRSGMRPR